MTRKITVEVSDVVCNLLEVLTKGEYATASDVEGVVRQLIDHAQQEVYRPGAWERQWLMQAFGDGWIEHLERGDPYDRNAEGSAAVFRRPAQR
jgi:Arc/MetJ-type ribon-helix-helix transcriptional regulator